MFTHRTMYVVRRTTLKTSYEHSDVYVNQHSDHVTQGIAVAKRSQMHCANQLF